MKDGLLKAMSSDGTIRAVIATTTELVELARRKHNLSFTATAALGRALTAGALLAPILAREGQVALKFQGNGPLGKVVVDASPRGTVRGYVENPQVELPLNSLGNFDVGGAIGHQGYLHVTIDHGFGMPQMSTVELASGEVGEDVNRYLVTSDQTGSLVVVGTHLSKNGVEAAGGLIVQLLPDHTEETICKIENNISTFGTFTFLMRRGMDLENILSRILNGFDVTPLTEVKPVSFYCKCTKERFVEALKVLSREDLMDMVEVEGRAEGRCQFCNELYLVEKEGLLDIARGK
ncbi:MAG: Hsp33 family molecular chaperone HslO [Cyanobacteria bacterium SZAS LIN-2]|nr:Hsp33 family molecular chaperone HslO [Cyanobacteria bacterium SZAS LIN-3]MBS1995755.1 Hsp33 family molecular chaperone HslO [Cyanobacteria bacterium SZAS LIN-2]MBS2006719.1 Hsp33 family molecular chaperone HslO [Cyanobacteria bacterium SZAS TMP-1]